MNRTFARMNYINKTIVTKKAKVEKEEKTEKTEKTPKRIIKRINSIGTKDGTRWTKEDTEICQEMFKNKKSFDEIGEVLQRKPGTIKFKRWNFEEDYVKSGMSYEEVGKLFGITAQEVKDDIKEKETIKNRQNTDQQIEKGDNIKDSNKKLPKEDQSKECSVLKVIDTEQVLKKTKSTNRTKISQIEDTQNDSDLLLIKKLWSLKKMHDEIGNKEESDKIFKQIEEKQNQFLNTKSTSLIVVQPASVIIDVDKIFDTPKLLVPDGQPGLNKSELKKYDTKSNEKYKKFIN
ncbi:MAG: hypothetical protein Terrestrivirus8_3 [Terrestrivirus sp.]|uniref:Uncharacterized protein n=1 Tax=Terrestrivirus sp. TaxID=2487775 RepID=A0A3G4ZNN3_9VIRU|nr:MAG: hypothetical protein Terrestrivirus8_3 [Terrestrivirus sp.]